jgi:hypothetical protein
MIKHNNINNKQNININPYKYLYLKSIEWNKKKKK